MLRSLYKKFSRRFIQYAPVMWGMGSVIAVDGYYTYQNVYHNGLEKDAAAIRSDWYRLGQDFREVDRMAGVKKGGVSPIYQSK